MTVLPVGVAVVRRPATIRHTLGQVLVAASVLLAAVISFPRIQTENSAAFAPVHSSDRTSRSFVGQDLLMARIVLASHR